jgi:hypothetical protein
MESDFPGLTAFGYEIKSPYDPGYNCVAFAVGDQNHFWYDAEVRGYYWPPGVGSADELASWIHVFSIHGYTKAENESLEPNVEKIAIYASSAGPEHVARQLSSGAWVSKLGKGHDIEHSSLQALEGELYGKVRVIMKRVCKDGRRVLE